MTAAGALIGARASSLMFASTDLNIAAADVESTTVEESVAALHAIREAVKAARQVEAGLERWVAQCFRAEGWGDVHELPGLGMIEVRRSKDRRAWQHDRIRADWLNAYMASRGGEQADPADVRDAFLEVASVSGYKVRALRALDLDPDDYCDSSPGTPTVSIA